MVETTKIEPTTVTGAPSDDVIQFSVFTTNRLGRLHGVVNLLGAKNVHVLAITVIDTTDSAIIRLVVDDPDRARDLFHEGEVAFAESRLVVTELNSAEELNKLFAAMVEAELNINYLYTCIPHPSGKTILALSVEDNELAAQTLKRHQFPVLKQADISR
jgi:hypothetical protein